MNLIFEFSEKNFLEHRLYTSKESKTFKKAISKKRILFFLIYIFLGISIVLLNSLVIGISFILIGLTWFIFYPSFFKYNYKNQCKKIIKESFSKIKNTQANLIITNNTIEIKDYTGSSSLKIEEINSLTEIPNIFLIRLSSGISIIIPKVNIKDTDLLIEKFKKLGINYIDDTTWQW